MYFFYGIKITSLSSFTWNKRKQHLYNFNIVFVFEDSKTIATTFYKMRLQLGYKNVISQKSKFKKLRCIIGYKKLTWNKII